LRRSHHQRAIRATATAKASETFYNSTSKKQQKQFKKQQQKQQQKQQSHSQ
jgi:hypothetical protein